MFFKWVDYCEKYEEEIETWTGDADTRRFATFDDGIKETHEYYMGISEDYDGHDYKLNETYFCKVVIDRDIIAAVLFIMRNDEYPYQITINPIIVSPKHRNKGYGIKIIGEFINNINDIIGFDNNVFVADISINNETSIRAFKKVAFVLAGTHISGDCAYWVYPASELESYRKRCAAAPINYFVASSTL
jgi:RimJ/RimL family protein N-acetyltransferase